MDEILYGSIWRMASPLLTTDDVVRLRGVASRWNVGNRCGEMGEFYFLPLQNDPYEKHWHCDMNGDKKYTMLKKNDSFVEGFRKWRLYGPCFHSREPDVRKSRSGRSSVRSGQTQNRGVHKYLRIHQNTVYWCNLKLAKEKGLQFYQTRSHAIAIFNTLPAILRKWKT